MKKILIIFIVILIISFGISDTFATENTDIFNNILKQTNGKTIEIGINADYEINKEGNQECTSWLKSVNLYNKQITNQTSSNSNNYSYSELLKTSNDVEAEAQGIKSKENINNIENSITVNTDRVYCREFQKGDIYGYIESTEVNNGSKINIFIRELSPKQNINDLSNRVKEAIGKKATDINIYKYLKAKTAISDTGLLQNKIINYLKGIDTKNISTVNINQGYSTVAYTQNFKPILDDGKYEDLNFAVLRESDKNYVILGTPVIDISY